MYNLSPETLLDGDSFNSDLRKFISDHGPKISVDNLLSKSIPTDVLKKNKVALTPNGQLFSIAKQGFLSEIMETMYEDRALFKNKAIEVKKQLELVKTEMGKRGLEYK
jgi:hypothetical protein